MADATVIARGTRISGRIAGEGDVEVHGHVDGEVEVSGDVTVGLGGLVGASIRGQRVTVRGAVKGDLMGDEAVVLEEGARVVGDIRAPRVAIGQGALVRGYVQTGADDKRAQPRAAAKAPAQPARSPARAPERAAAPKAPPPPPPSSKKLVVPASKKGQPPPPVVALLKKGAKASLQKKR